MTRVFDYLDTALYWIVAGMIAVLAAVGFAGVIFRYVLQSSLFWADEFLRYWDIWLIFLAAALATRHRGLITVDIFISPLPHRIRHRLDAAVNFVAVIFLATLIWYSWELVTRSAGGSSAVMRVPMDKMYLVFPIGLGLMAINCLRQVFAHLKEASEGPPVSDDGLQLPNLLGHAE